MAYGKGKKKSKGKGKRTANEPVTPWNQGGYTREGTRAAYRIKYC